VLTRFVGAHFSTPYIRLFNDSESITVVINIDIKEYMKEGIGKQKTYSAEYVLKCRLSFRKNKFRKWTNKELYN
jgi:hypothetical protein